MLTYVATLLLSFLVHGPWRDPDGFNFPESRLFAEAATLAPLWPGTRLHLVRAAGPGGGGCWLAVVDPHAARVSAAGGRRVAAGGAFRRF